MAKLDPYAFGTAHMSQRDWMKKQLSAESKMKVFGTDAGAKIMKKGNMKGTMTKGKKMTASQIANRKRTMISNAASKAMNLKYSK